MDDSYIYRFRPRVTGEQSAYSWYPHPPRQRKKEYHEHSYPVLKKLENVPVDFVVNHEWISEDVKRDCIAPFKGRRWCPWPWEFSGARYWPQMTVENILEEQRQLKALLTSRDVPQEPRPVTGKARDCLDPPMQVRITPVKTAWRPKTSLWSGYVANQDGCVYGDPSRPPGRPDTIPFSRHLKNHEDYKFAHGFEDYYDHESPYHFHHPDDVKLTGGSHVKCYDKRHTPKDRKNAMTILPNIALHERPRFERPFLNSANAMWIGAGFATSPAQN